MKPTYSRPTIVTAQLEMNLRAIVVRWQELFHGDIVRECCDAQWSHVSTGRAKTLIMDARDAKGAPPQEIQKWFATDLFPRLSQAGLKALITILPTSAVTKLASTQWTQTGAAFSFTVKETDSLENAYALAQDVLRA